MSLSLLLLIGAGLFVRSLPNLKDLDPGFRPRICSPLPSIPDPMDTKRAQSAILPSVEGEPGFYSRGRIVGLAVVPVLEGNEWDNWVSVENFRPKPGEWIDPHVNYVSPDYFKTLDIPILAGRDFRITDAAGAPKVAIVNEKFARQYFSGECSRPAYRLRRRPGTKLDIEIVGVVRDTKYESMRDEMPIEVFTPYLQITTSTGCRHTSEPAAS